ncbi:MAG: hypothetical protein IJT44_04070 [Clostridia bacterium]|nr:hypothetical protein [Clostridia bacterium]
MDTKSSVPSTASDNTNQNHDAKQVRVHKVNLRPVRSNAKPKALKTRHGRPLILGYLIRINGKPAIAYMKENQAYGFVYLDEIIAIVFDADCHIPEYILEAMSP